MAKVLFTLRGRPGIQPGIYKRGDPVCVIPASHDWGELSVLPNFLRIEFLGIAEDHPRLLAWVEPDLVQDGYEGDGVTPNMVHRWRRRWRFLIDHVPQAIRNLATSRDAGGTIGANTAHIRIGPNAQGGDYTFVQVRAYLHDRVTDQTEADFGAVL